MKKLILIHGSYYNKNFGDFLLLKRVINEFSTCDVRLPFASQKVLDEFNGDIKPMKLGDFFKTKKCIFGGGGYLGEPNQNVDRWSLNFIRRHFLPFLLLKVLGVEVYIIGAGFGPITKSWLKPLVSYMLKNSSVVMLRDAESKLLASNLCPDVKIEQVTDLAQDKAFLESEVLKNSIDSRKYIAMHIGTVLSESQLIELTNVNLELKRLGFDFVLFSDSPGHNRTIENEEDKLFKTINFGYDKRIYKSADEVIYIIKNSAGLVTGKLHTGIIASTFGVPVLSIPTHQKTVRYYNDIGSPESCLFGSTLIEEKKRIKLFLEKVTNETRTALPDDVLKKHAKAIDMVRKLK